MPEIILIHRKFTSLLFRRVYFPWDNNLAEAVHDYKDFLETFSGLACVIAVNLKVENGDNRYQVVDGNEAYINSVVDSPEKFESNVPYV